MPYAFSWGERHLNAVRDQAKVSHAHMYVILLIARTNPRALLCRLRFLVYSVSPSLFLLCFPELSLTPENLSTVLDSMDDSLWERFSNYVNTPVSEQERIKSQYSSNRERKQAAINSLISGHPAPSWRLVAHALYKMGSWYEGDVVSCHRTLDCLQQLFPTGTATPCTVCVQIHVVFDM